MAASMKVTRFAKSLSRLCKNNHVNLYAKPQNNVVHGSIVSRCYGTRNNLSWRFTSNPKRKVAAGVALALGAGAAGVAGYFKLKSAFTVTAESGQPPKIEPSRIIKSSSDTTGLKLTLYQYQTCPFCCKARAYLDYYGFSYDVVEVNSVWRTQIKWSNYKKVPILVCDGQGEDGHVQLNDSSVIISLLDSFLEDRSLTLDKLLTYYPGLETKNEKGKKVIEYPNKYFIMYGDKVVKSATTAQMNLDETESEERKWRTWTDKHLVHIISPNIYRTRQEAMEAFRYFDEVGEWEKHFSSFERKVILYVGATVMYYLGKMLKKKYNLKEDVRVSLYDACYEWTRAVGKDREFLGGDRPNLADLSVYGVLTSMEGCSTFKDMMDNNTKMKDWYYRTKHAVDHHIGTQVR